MHTRNTVYKEYSIPFSIQKKFLIKSFMTNNHETHTTNIFITVRYCNKGYSQKCNISYFDVKNLCFSKMQ